MAMKDGYEAPPDDIWFEQNAPKMPTGPVTSDSDPRLSNPAYASDPDVLSYINNGRGANTVNGPAPNGPTATYTPTGTGGGGTNFVKGHTYAQGQIPGLTQYDPGVFTDGTRFFDSSGKYISDNGNEAMQIVGGGGMKTSRVDDTFGPGGQGDDQRYGRVNPDGTMTDQFGNPYTSYRSNPNAPAPPNDPSRLSPYVQPVWNGTAPTATRLAQYRAPTQAELEASPGYQARMAARQKGFERSAAAKGSILSGGTIIAADRDAQDFASNEYANLVGQGQTTTQINNAATQGDNTNAFDTYKQTYGEFADAANLGLGARQQNVSENNTAFNQGQVNYGNRYTQYLDANNRTLQDYLTNQAAKRNSETDYWNRLMDLNNTGANAANNSYRFAAL